MRDGISLFFKVRVLDPVSGAVLIDPLPHPHQITYEAIYPQTGMPGRSAIGSIHIPLWGPATDQYKWAKADYDKLLHMARLELYPSLSPNESQGAWGNPCATGIITGMPKDLETFAIEGMMSEQLLAQHKTRSNETTLGNTTDAIFQSALKGYSMVFGDDFTSANLSANYTQSPAGVWTFTSTDGMSAYQRGAGTSEGIMLTNTSFGNANYHDCLVHAPMTTVTQAASGAYAEMGVVAAAADANNFILGQALVFYVNSTTYRVDVAIWQRSGGTYSQKALVQGVLPLTQSTFRGQVQLNGFQINSTQYRWTVLINETDVGCTWVQAIAPGAPTGAVGFRCQRAASGASQNETVYAVKQFLFLNKTSLFATGSIGAGSQSPLQPIPSMPLIEVISLAATTENASYRKNPKPGLGNDTFDFNHAATSTDLTASVKLEEGVNLSTASIEPNAEALDTALLLAGSPTPDGNGRLRWFNVAAINKYGLIEDTSSAPGYANGVQLRQAADAILTHRATPDQAKRLDIVRTADLLPSATTSSTLVCREGDKVTLHVPREGIYNTAVKLLSAKVAEGSPIVQCTADQYPYLTDNAPTVDRLMETVRGLAEGRQTASLQAIDSGGIPTGTAHPAQIILPINPYKMRVWYSVQQTIADNATVQVLFDTVTFDTANGYSLSTNQYTAPVSGYYFISAKVGVVVPAIVNSDPAAYSAIYINGTQAAEGTISKFRNFAGIGYAFGTNVFDTLFLNAGDTVQVWAQVGGGGGNWKTRNGTDLTYWSLHLVSR